ncbi:MAG: hypothetical protein AAFV07_01550, partial [Bacteroidota bacterium]
IKNRARLIRALVIPVPRTALRAYRIPDQPDSVLIQSYHRFPLEITGFGRGKTANKIANPPHFIPAYTPQAPDRKLICSIPPNADRIFFNLPGLERTFHTEIRNWSLPHGLTTAQQIWRQPLDTAAIYWEIRDSLLRFLPGVYTLQKDIVIPAGYQVEIPSHTEINLTKGARILSRSPIFIYGQADAPVRIWSSDGTGQGLSVFQTHQKSVIRHTRFEGLTTVQSSGWGLTGAVTFYEADVDIAHCAFIGNTCEDGLNLVRSKFTLHASLIAETFSDGFDADFCTGTITKSVFRATGNDGMDFSGSNIRVFDTRVLQAGDKGISVGEDSKVTVRRLSVDGAVIGAAAKDFSRLEVAEAQFSNCRTGFAAYQKKPEFGPATISASKFRYENIQALHMIEPGSRLWLNGNLVDQN